MLYHHPTNYCCYSPSSFSLLAHDGEKPNRHLLTRNNHPPTHLILIYRRYMLFVALWSAYNPSRMLSSVCGSLLFILHVEHKICQHIKSTVKTVTAPYIRCLSSRYWSNKLVEGGLERCPLLLSPIPTSA